MPQMNVADPVLFHNYAAEQLFQAAALWSSMSETWASNLPEAMKHWRMELEWKSF